MRNKSNESRGSHGGCVLLTLGAFLLAGCEIGSERKSPQEMKARDLEREKAQLAGQLEQAQVEIAQLKAQVKTLATWPSEKQKGLFALSSVKIIRFTGLYDKDGDGKKEKLIVYLQPVDQAGDAVKVPGMASVQLWNLNNPDGQALLGQWQVPPEEIGKLWFSTLTSLSFRLTFDFAVTPELLAVPLTVKSTFSDCLTGKTCTDQFVIQPKSEPAEQ